MVATPVLTQVKSVLKPRFEAAKQAGQIPADAEFVIKSFGRKGSSQREYACVDGEGNPFVVIETFIATPTICDY